MSRAPLTTDPSEPTGSARWQLVLLGFTSIALSVASGWTTWDGMANFTFNPVLSFLLTFGIQGVMLISAWLIGETLVQAPATLSRRKAVGRPIVGKSRLTTFLVPLSSALVFLVGIGWLSATGNSTVQYPQIDILAASALLVAGVILLRRILFATGNGDLVRPYETSLKSILRNVPLWLMFLTCMAISVFFSFDSLFEKTYSANDRAVASHSRVRNHVSELIADLAALLEERRRDAVDRLFASSDWKALDGEIDRLIDKAHAVLKMYQTAQADVAQERNRETARLKKVLSLDRSRLELLDQRIKASIRDRKVIDIRLDTMKTEVAGLNESFSVQTLPVRKKRMEAQNEAAGDGVSGLAGKGPLYRAIKREEAELQLSADLVVERLETARNAVAAASEEKNGVSSEIARLEDERASLQGALDAAGQQLQQLEQLPAEGGGASRDLIEKTNGLNAASLAFRNSVARETMAALHIQCADLAASLPRATPAQDQSARSRCNTALDERLTGAVFAGNAALTRFRAACAGKIDLVGLSTHELIEFGHRCIQETRLASNATAALRTRLRQVARRRDDSAHRFIVTTNSLFDMNPLAFVALFIALSMDGLVFISGLFGAKAEARLSARNDKSTNRKWMDTEALLDAALLPKPRETARAILQAIDIQSLESGYACEIHPEASARADVSAIRAVMAAACAADLAKPAGPGGRFLLKGDLLGYLSGRAAGEVGTRPGTAVASVSETLLAVFMGSEKRQSAQLLMEISRPLSPDSGFVFEVDPDIAGPEVSARITRILNVGVANGTVFVDAASDGLYRLTSDFVAMIARAATQDSLAWPAEPPALDGEDRSGLPHSRPPTGGHGRDTEDEARESVARNFEPARMAPSPVAGPGERSDERKEANQILFSKPEETGEASRIVDRDLFKETPDEETDASVPTEPEPGVPAAKGGLRIIPGDRESPGATRIFGDPDTVFESGTDENASSKLIAFPRESKPREQPQPGAETRLQTFQLAELSEKDDFAAGFATNFSAMGVSLDDLVALASSAREAECADAWSAYNTLCSRGEDRLHTSRKLRVIARNRLLLFIQRACERSADATATPDQPSDLQSSEAIAMTECLFVPFFMLAHGFKQARGWCEEAVAGQELAASIGVASDEFGRTLEAIAECCRRLQAADPVEESTWAEFQLRIATLRRNGAETEMFNEIMP